MGNLYEDLGSSSPDGLMAASYPTADVFHITIRKLSSETTLERGTLLDLSTGTAGDGKYVIHGTNAIANEILTANCILDEDTVVGAESDVIARAYRTGHFIKENLIVADGASISDADKNALRDVGILLSSGVNV